MHFEFTIPGPSSGTILRIESGTSAIFVGANGGGKTRLAVLIEQTAGQNAHRISAHRALALNPEVAKISEAQAKHGLKHGNALHPGRDAYRWQSKNATYLLNDFDYVVQALFAEQANRSVITHKKARANQLSQVDPTKFEILSDIWDRLLPHRKLDVSGDNILVSSGSAGENYSASEMSDGERAIFYLVGQVLVADTNSLLIFDEPELHVHRSIMGKLWDELEAVRPDCAFVLITHDLEFAASRDGQKFLIRSYTPQQGWIIEIVPEDTGFSEEITTLILGSRRPILFVEGANGSLDRMIYRACYPEWTVISRGSCETVIHAVVTMRANASLTRVTCSGIVDADDHDAAYLARLGVAALPVSEIENLILLPDVSKAIAESEGYTGSELLTRLDALKQELFSKIDEPGALERVVVTYCRRRIDRILKKIDLSDANNVADIAGEYGRQTSALDVVAIGAEIETQIRKAVQEDNLPAFLRFYDDKGFLAAAAKHLKGMGKKDFTAWLGRVMRNDAVPALTTAIRGHLPPVAPQ